MQYFFFIFDRVGKIVKKGENAAYCHFLIFLTIISKVFSSRVVKVKDSLVKGEVVILRTVWVKIRLQSQVWSWIYILRDIETQTVEVTGYIGICQGLA